MWSHQIWLGELYEGCRRVHCDRWFYMWNGQQFYWCQGSWWRRLQGEPSVWRRQPDYYETNPELTADEWYELELLCEEATESGKPHAPGTSMFHRTNPTPVPFANPHVAIPLPCAAVPCNICDLYTCVCSHRTDTTTSYDTSSSSEHVADIIRQLAGSSAEAWLGSEAMPDMEDPIWDCLD